jgi:Uncharacterized conserved protein
MPDTVYTIGHSNHALEIFIDLLRAHGITAVADVRSHPVSKFNPQFNRYGLRVQLKLAGLAYVFLGRELGARPEDESCYINGKVQYDLLARTPLFQEGLSRIIKGARSHRIALMCAEKDPLTCHRAILVCRYLAVQGISSQHILENGRLEGHDEALSRLLEELGLSEANLFTNRNQALLHAYDQRAKEIAYARKFSPMQSFVRAQA